METKRRTKGRGVVRDLQRARGGHPAVVMVASAVASVILWQVLVTFFKIPGYVLPAPLAVAKALVDGLSYGVTERAGFWFHLIDTLKATLVGFGIGAAIGLLLAMIMAEYPSVETIALPYIVGLQSMPKVAIAPLMIIWFGYGLSSKIAMAVLLTLFPVLVNSLEGFRSTERDRIELLASLNASRWQTFRYVKFPSALPSILTGFDLAIVYALLGTIVSELVGAQKGMGVIITQLQTVSDVAGVFAALVILAVTGYALHAILRFIQKRVVFWAESSRREAAP